MEDRKIVLATGGTGGHLFPAEALASELLQRGYGVTIMMDRRVDGFKGMNDGIDIRFVRSGYFKPGVAGKLRALFNLGLGFAEALCHLYKTRPGLVVGFGGYSAFPTVLAAQVLRIPTMLHEQNAVLGKANGVLARFAKVIALSQPDTRGINVTERNKTVLTGNPVRGGIIAAAATPYALPAADGDIRILVTGGSQAASIFSDVIPKALALLPQDIKDRLDVAHQCKSVDIDATAEAYRQAGIRAETEIFFADMPRRLSGCHVFIGRSGASTVAEVAAVGRPAVFVPYPGNADQQQKYNAAHMVDTGGALMFMQHELTPEILAAQLGAWLAEPAALARAAAASRACGRPDATKNLAEVVSKLFPR